MEPPRPSTRLSTLNTAPTVAANRSTEPAKLGALVRGELDWIVMRCLEKDRVRRYDTASSLAEDVRRFLGNEPIAAGPPSGVYRARKFLRRHRTPVAVAALVVLLLIAGIAGTTFGLLEARRQRDEVARQRDEANHQKQKALDANENTKAVNDYLTHDVLGSADPAIAQGRELTVKEALDNAARNVTGGRFRNRPLLEASVRNALALTYDALGHTDLAIPHERAALDIRRRLLGADDPDTIESVTNLALFLQYQGKFDEAEPMYRDAVERSRRVLGDDHPETLRRQFDLGSLFMDFGKFDQAERTFRDVLERRRRVLGDEDPDTIATSNYLAGALMNQGRLEEAEPLYRHALEQRRRLLGNLHPSTIMSVSDLGVVLSRQGRLDESEPLKSEALASYRQVLGDDHPSTLIALNNLAQFLDQRGKFDEAEAIYREALDRSRRVQGEQHPFTIVAKINLGQVLGERGKYADADAMLRDALAGCRKEYGEDHAYTLAALDHLITVLIEEQKFADAEPLASELYRKSLDAQGSPKSIARYISKYGLVLAKLNRLTEADLPLHDAMDRLGATGQARSQTMVVVLRALLRVCDATGRAEEAAKLRPQLASAESATRPATTSSSTTMEPTTR